MDGSDFETWEQFERALETMEISGLSQGSGPLFRGQSNSAWGLDTTLERRWPSISVHEYYHRALNVKLPIETLTSHKWEPIRPQSIDETLACYDAFSVKLTLGQMPAYDYLLYLRHHGFPSPLLDWSRSPFIAAYFAFAHSLPKEAPERVAIFAYVERPQNIKIWSGGDPEIHVLGPQVPAHRRHFLQKSEYTVCIRWTEESWRFAPHDKVLSGDRPGKFTLTPDGEVLSRGQAAQDVIRKFTLPSSEGPKVLENFDRYNLNGFSLFGSEESLMETMALRETVRARQESGNNIDLRILPRAEV